MEIISTTLHSTLSEELVMCLFALLIIPIMTFFMITRPDKRLSTKVKIIAIIINIVLILTMWKACLGRVYEYELIEVKVNDWNEIINSEDFELIEYEGNKATLKRVKE